MNRRAFLASAAAAGAIGFAGTARADALIVNSPGDGFLNLRKGPGTSYEILMPMYNGAHVEVLGASGSWLQVRHPSGTIGWAHRRYLVD